VQQERLLSSTPSGRKRREAPEPVVMARVSTAIHKHQPTSTSIAADIPATAGIIFMNFLSGKRRINNKAKSIETQKHDPWF
jgi:hypothetical protein